MVSARVCVCVHVSVLALTVKLCVCVCVYVSLPERVARLLKRRTPADGWDAALLCTLTPHAHVLALGLVVAADARAGVATLRAHYSSGDSDAVWPRNGESVREKGERNVCVCVCVCVCSVSCANTDAARAQLVGWLVASQALLPAWEARALPAAGSPLQLAAATQGRLSWPVCVALFALVAGV